jgi:anti-anti-sigma factor
MRIEFDGEVMVVYASQLFAGAEAKRVAAQVNDALQTGRITSCVFDFKKTDMIDSSGIGILVTLAKDFNNKNSSLILKNLEDEIFQLFESTGLDRVFSIETDRGMRPAHVSLFNTSVDIRLNIKKESIGDIGVVCMSGVLNHPLGSSFFKQQVLLFLTEHKNILLDLEELTFFDSLSISAILNLNNLLKGTGGTMKICCPNYIVKDLLVTLSIDLIIPVFDQRQEAFADWGCANAK